MPGPRIEMKLMRCFADAGGCDLWQGSCLEGCHQWWIGWQHPNTLKHWSWPSDDWVLIGCERWHQRPRGALSSSRPFYANPTPLAHRPPCPAPSGYWHVCYSHSGRQTWQQWVGTPLVEDDEDQLYLKGGRSILVKSIPTYAVAERACAWGTGAEVCIGAGNWRPSVHAQGA